MSKYSYLALKVPVDSSRFEKLHEYLASKFKIKEWQSEYHITVRFCSNDIPDSKLVALGKELDGILENIAPFQIVLDSLGCFAGQGDNCPLFVTCKNVPAELLEMNKKAEDVLKKYAQGSEYDFAAHVSLGRIYKDDNTYKQLQSALREYKKDNPVWIRTMVKDVTFINAESRKNQSPLHTEVYSKELKLSAEAEDVKKKKDEHDEKIRDHVHRNDGKPVIYIDMDNTIVDFSSALYKLPQRMIDEAKDGEMDNIPGIYAIMDPIPNAIKSVNYLAGKYDVYILSTSPWDNPSAWSDKLIWIKRYLGDEMWKKLILSHNKNLNRGRFLIDDAEKNGAKKFGEIPGQEHIKIFSDKFPDWNSVVEYIDQQLQV